MIQLQNIGKAYETRRGPRWVFRNVDLTIGRGEKIGILGRNGAGKSTLIRMISGIEMLNEGRIVTDISISWPLAFSGAFQQSLTGADNVRFICRVYGKNVDDVIALVDDFAELGAYMNEPIKSYSAGMRARLGFGVSLAVDFDCFLIDEIVAVGDARFQQKCHDELFVKRRDRSMIIVSHNDGYIREHCDRAGVLAQQTLTNFADMDEAYAFYKAHERE